MAYLEHLRDLDARNQARREQAELAETQADESHAAPRHPSEAFPWYSPSDTPASLSTPEAEPAPEQLLEAWYAPRPRQRTLPRDAAAAERARLRYGLPKPDEEGGIAVSEARARPWRSGADVRMRHRAAQVVADVDESAFGAERTAADGWTLIGELRGAYMLLFKKRN